MSQEKRIQVLLECFFCDPTLQSVSLIGYKWFRDLQDLADVTLLTHTRNKNVLTPEIKGGTKAVYIGDVKLSSRIWYISQSMPKPLRALADSFFQWLDYKIFAMAAKKKVRELMKTSRFDVFHRVTPVTQLCRSDIPSLGIPSVVGPLNYAMDWPKGFERSEYATKVGQSTLYDIMSKTIRALRGPSFGDYKKILVATKSTEAAVPKKFRDRCEMFVENGVDAENFTFKIGDRKPVHCVYVGRLVPFKAVDILMEGFQKALKKDPDLVLTIVGKGQEREALDRIAASSADRIRFTGEIPNLETVGHFQEADIFLMSSLRESGGGVVLEAMSCGAVPVVADHAGPSEIVNSETGIKVPCVSREQLVDDFAAAILKLAADTPLRHRLAKAGRQAIEQEFDWKMKAKRMVGIYRGMISP
jgi:glycosyltransferase involved in cell wall biosynthesis